MKENRVTNVTVLFDENESRVYSEHGLLCMYANCGMKHLSQPIRQLGATKTSFKMYGIETKMLSLTDWSCR